MGAMIAAAPVRPGPPEGRAHRGYGEAMARRLVRIRLLAPLAHRDFALLWAGMSVSLLGDGVYYVAIAWQVYQLSHTPTALALVGVAYTAPQLLLLLLGGVVSDRLDRRWVLIGGSLLSGTAIGVLGGLAASGRLELSWVFALVAVHGAGQAFALPAFSALVPDLVPAEQVAAASSMTQFFQPLALMLVGPALGGGLILAVGTGPSFVLDAATFVVAALVLRRLRARPPAPAGERRRSLRRDLREGLAFTASHTWLWGTLVAASIFLLVWDGPFEVLLPYLVKFDLRQGAGALGLVYAAGGLGAVATAPLVAQLGLPRRAVLVMYGAWTGGALGLVVFGLATRLWVLVAVSVLAMGLMTAGNIIWAALMGTMVPGPLRGRVASLDWLVSNSLVPVSMGLTGPVAAALGARATLVAAGLAAAAVTTGFLFLPGIRHVAPPPGAPPRTSPVAPG